MTTQQIVKFLDAHKDVPQMLRDKLIRMHSGRWPTWRALSMRREGNTIVEIAAWCRDASEEPFVVLRWRWSESAEQESVGVRWRSYATLKEAREHKERTFSLAAVNVDLRA